MSFMHVPLAAEMDFWFVPTHGWLSLWAMLSEFCQRAHTFYSHSFSPLLLFFCSVFSVKVLHNIHRQSYNNYWVDCRGRCSSAAQCRRAPPCRARYFMSTTPSPIFFTRFFSSEKSFKREWKMAAIWQLSPKVSASMVFCLALAWRQEDSNRERVWLFVFSYSRNKVLSIHSIPYAHHYKPRLVFFFTPFFTAAYTAERLIFHDSFQN